MREQPVIPWVQLPIIFELQTSDQAGVRNTDRALHPQPAIPSVAIDLQHYNMVHLSGRGLVESPNLVMGGGTQSPYQNPLDLGFFCRLRPLEWLFFLCVLPVASGPAWMLLLVANLLGQVYQVC